MPFESVLKQKNRKEFYQKTFSYNGTLQAKQKNTIKQVELFFFEEKMILPLKLYNADKNSFFVGQYVLSILEYTQILIAQQKLIVQNEIINNELNSLIELLKIVFKDNYPNDFCSDDIDEYWDFLRNAFEEAILYQFSLDSIKKRTSQYLFVEQLSSGVSIDTLVKIQKRNYQRRLERITSDAETNVLDSFFSELAAESNQHYYRQSEATLSKIGFVIVIILSAIVLMLNMPEASLLFVVLGSAVSYISSIFFRDLKPSVRQQILDSAASIDEKYRISEKDAHFQIMRDAAKVISMHGDPDCRFTKKEIIVAQKTYTIYSNNIDNDAFVSNLLSDSNPTNPNLKKFYSQPKTTAKPFATSKFIADISPKFVMKKGWILPENEDGVVIQGQKKSNPNSFIYISFNKNSEENSELIEKIKSGRYGFAAKRREIGFKFMQHNQYTLKEMDGTRWDFFKQGAINLKNSEGEIKNIPHYVSGRMRYK